MAVAPRCRREHRGRDWRGVCDQAERLPYATKCQGGEDFGRPWPAGGGSQTRHDRAAAATSPHQARRQDDCAIDLCHNAGFSLATKRVWLNADHHHARVHLDVLRPYWCVSKSEEDGKSLPRRRWRWVMLHSLSGALNVIAELRELVQSAIDRGHPGFHGEPGARRLCLSPPCAASASDL